METIEEAEMDPIKSENLELESPVNNDGSNEILSVWEELFPETKTVLMPQLENCINNIDWVHTCVRRFSQIFRRNRNFRNYAQNCCSLR